jgi:type II secretory pathway component PulC
MSGLRKGDLVVAINGTALDDASRGNDIFGSLGNASEARVTVLRAGRAHEITVNMAQLTGSPD